ncbi:hypothetical protein BpHYR1_052802, partial [Brachionus plicatilis]
MTVTALICPFLLNKVANPLPDFSLSIEKELGKTLLPLISSSFKSSISEMYLSFFDGRLKQIPIWNRNNTFNHYFNKHFLDFTCKYEGLIGLFFYIIKKKTLLSYG